MPPTAPAGRGRVVRCPICLSDLDWESAPTFVRQGDEWAPAPVGGSARQRDFLLRRTYRACSGTLLASGEGATHYLPARFGEAGVRQLVIGLVGETSSGKTHLLATIVHRLLDRETLRRKGLRVEPLDADLHEQYMAENVRPLMDRAEALRPTPAGRPVGFTDGFLVTNEAARRSFAVAFFDVAGERIAAGREDTAFFLVADALMFVVDPTTLGRAQSGDRTFERVLSELPSERRLSDGWFFRMPTAVVLAKSDRFLIQEGTVAHWLHRRLDDDLDLGTVKQESEDVYAFISARGGDAWLRPAEVCFPNSLHFVSATGRDIDDRDHFGDVVRPRRVLKPLLSLFAMAGLIEADA
jgi:double-GTPase-like protein